MAPARHARRGPASDQAWSDRPNASPRRLGRPAASARLPKPTPSSQLIVGGAIPGARVSPRARPAAGCPPAALTGAHIRRGRGRSAEACSRGRRDVPRRAHPPPKRWRPHSAIGCNGVFCSSCDDENSAQVCGVSPSFKRNSSTRRDLPMPGSPTTSANWPSPLDARSQRRRKRSSSSSRPTSGVRARAPQRRAAARAHDPKERRPARARLSAHARRDPRRRKPGHLTLHASRDQDRPRLGQRLHARGDIGRIAKDFSGRIHHHRPALDADAGDKLRRARTGVLAIEFGERALDGQRGANGAFGIVLLRNRVAEQTPSARRRASWRHVRPFASPPPRRRRDRR